MSRLQLTVLGSGWGAFRLLQRVDPQKFSVTLVSPRNHVLFTPLLASASVGTLNPGSICEPLWPHCAPKGVRFREAHAQAVDVMRKQVHCKSIHGDFYTIDFDRLVVAVGKQANDFNIPGIRRHALFMKQTADASRLREALFSRLAEASCLHARVGGEEPSPDQRAKLRQLLSIVVVGGGPTSVGFATELNSFIARDIPHIYPHLRGYISVHLVEWANSDQSTQLHTHDQALRDYALKRFSSESGVQMHRGEKVVEANAHSLRLASGKVIPCGTLVWNAGTKSVPLVESLELPKCQFGSRLLTDDFLRVQGHKDIFAIGDCAEVGGSGFVHTAHLADQQGAYLAHQFNRVKPFKKPFVLRGTGALVQFGSSKLPGAHTVVGRTVYSYLAWLGWRSASWNLQFSMRHRVAIIYDRLINLMFGRSFTRLGQDTVEQPSSRPTALGTSSQVALDEQISVLLSDIGLCRLGGGFLDPELMAERSAQTLAPPAVK